MSPSIWRTLPTNSRFGLQTCSVVEHESDNKAEMKAFASLSSRIAKFAVMLDVAMIQPPNPSYDNALNRETCAL